MPCVTLARCHCGRPRVGPVGIRPANASVCEGHAIIEAKGGIVTKKAPRFVDTRARRRSIEQEFLADEHGNDARHVFRRPDPTVPIFRRPQSMPAVGSRSMIATCASSLCGSHTSSASRKAMYSPRRCEYPNCAWRPCPDSDGLRSGKSFVYTLCNTINEPGCKHDRQ